MYASGQKRSYGKMVKQGARLSRFQQFALVVPHAGKMGDFQGGPEGGGIGDGVGFASGGGLQPGIGGGPALGIGRQQHLSFPGQGRPVGGRSDSLCIRIFI